jgi:uncharacterized protein (TIGR02996 family)
MHEAADFLRLILDAPNDDGPRLIYADWLDERGDDDRAEFIRLQCAAAALPAGAAQSEDLRRRAQELLGRRRAAWLQPIRTALGLRPRGWLGWLSDPEPDPLRDAQFRCGFVAELHLPAGLFLDHAAELVRQTPLRKLTLDFPPSELESESLFARLLDCPQLAVLAALDVNAPRLVEDMLPRLLRLPAVQGLREFGVISPELDPGRVAALRGVPLLNRLTRLRLHADGNWAAAGVEALLSASEFPALTDLALNNVGLDAAGVALLASSDLATRLTGLDLSHNPLGAFRLRTVVTNLATRLTGLDLSHNPPDSEGLRTLLAGPWPALTHLALDDTCLGNAGASELAASPHLRRLERVSLMHNSIGGIGAMALASSPHLVGRTKVVLADNLLGPPERRTLRSRLGDRVEW